VPVSTPRTDFSSLTWRSNSPLKPDEDCSKLKNLGHLATKDDLKTLKDEITRIFSVKKKSEENQLKNFQGKLIFEIERFFEQLRNETRKRLGTPNIDECLKSLHKEILEALREKNKKIQTYYSEIHKRMLTRSASSSKFTGKLESEENQIKILNLVEECQTQISEYLLQIETSQTSRKQTLEKYKQTTFLLLKSQSTLMSKTNKLLAFFENDKDGLRKSNNFQFEELLGKSGRKTSIKRYLKKIKKESSKSRSSSRKGSLGFRSGIGRRDKKDYHGVSQRSMKKLQKLMELE
jgi:hypothetical protein